MSFEYPEFNMVSPYHGGSIYLQTKKEDYYYYVIGWSFIWNGQNELMSTCNFKELQ